MLPRLLACSSSHPFGLERRRGNIVDARQQHSVPFRLGEAARRAAGRETTGQVRVGRYIASVPGNMPGSRPVAALYSARFGFPRESISTRYLGCAPRLVPPPNPTKVPFAPLYAFWNAISTLLLFSGKVVSVDRTPNPCLPRKVKIF